MGIFIQMYKQQLFDTGYTPQNGVFIQNTMIFGHPISDTPVSLFISS